MKPKTISRESWRKEKAAARILRGKLAWDKLPQRRRLKGERDRRRWVQRGGSSN